MSKKQVVNFIERIKDPEEKAEWIKYVERNYDREKEYRSRYFKRYNQEYKEKRRIKNEMLYIRKVVSKNPYIAFDLFEGKLTYPNPGIRKGWGKGWTERKGDRSYCKSCHRMRVLKYGDDCESPEHHRAYERTLKLQRERYVPKSP